MFCKCFLEFHLVNYIEFLRRNVCKMHNKIHKRQNGRGEGEKFEYYFLFLRKSGTIKRKNIYDRKKFKVKLFSRGKKNRENEARAMALHGKIIRYVTTRDTGEEIVLGRGGSTAVHDGQLIVLSSGEIIFRSDIRETTVSHLLSGDGVVLSAPNLVAGGVRQTITAFFVDHIK